MPHRSSLANLASAKYFGGLRVSIGTPNIGAKILKDLAGDGARFLVEAGGKTDEWPTWTPQRSDAILVGTLGKHLLAALGGRVRVGMVYVLPETIVHYRSNHLREFNIARAESLVWQVLADPLFVTHSRQKRATLVFLGRFDDSHFLAIPPKTVGPELWQESLYIRTEQKVVKSGWNEGELLYERK
jgi:hypothetical protein